MFKRDAFTVICPPLSVSVLEKSDEIACVVVAAWTAQDSAVEHANTKTRLSSLCSILFMAIGLSLVYDSCRIHVIANGAPPAAHHSDTYTFALLTCGVTQPSYAPCVRVESLMRSVFPAAEGYVGTSRNCSWSSPCSQVMTSFM